MSPRRLALAFLIPLSWVIACDQQPPVGPILEARVGGAGGPTVEAPSNTHASAVSDGRIDVSWQDNSSNESGFEVHRSTSGASGVFSLVASTGAGATSFGSNGLTPSTQYCYKVRAFRNYDGKTSYSAFSNIACATTLPPPLPAAPSGMNATPDGSRIHLAWSDNATNESGFRVERAGSSNGPWTTLASIAQPNVAESDDGQPPAVEQPACYRVFAVNGAGDSPSSNVDCTTIPAAPTSVTAAVTGSDVDITWTDKSAVEDGFRVLRDGIVVATLPANATAYHDPGLADGTYSYNVLATKDGGTSVQSGAPVVTVDAPPVAPFHAFASPSGSAILIIWYYTPLYMPAGFHVERSSDDGVHWDAVGEAASEDGSILDWGAWSEQQMCYRVIAFNSSGDSDPANSNCTALPAPPSNLQATPATISGAIELTWTDNSRVEDGYMVVRVNYGVVATVGPNITSYRHSGVKPGDSYTYYVVALKDNGTSDQSNVASTTAP
jgi:Fibronectin type III domain